MAHSFHQNLAHIVFGTKNRDPLIAEPWRDRLYAYIGGAIRDSRGKAWSTTIILPHPVASSRNVTGAARSPEVRNAEDFADIFKGENTAAAEWRRA